MKALVAPQSGSLDNLQFEEKTLPEVQDHEVLVKVQYGGVNPSDAAIVLYNFGMAFPFSSGSDISGTVEKVGAGVTDFQPGDAVFASLDWMKHGGFAEYVVTDAKYLAKKPASLSAEEAAGVPMASITSWQGLFDHAGLQPGQRVLIQGAAGGLGSFAVQLAKWKGAYVIGTASTGKVDYVKSLGADEVIDYTKQSVGEVVKDVDVVYDVVGGEARQALFGTLKKGGILVSSVPSPIQAPEVEKGEVRGEVFYFAPNGKLLSQIADLFDQKTLTVHIDQVFPFSEARQAIEAVGGGHAKGKTVIQIGE